MDNLKKIFVKYEEIIMYIIMGVCTTLVYYIARFGSRILMGDISNGAMIATAIAQVVAITFAFITNKKYVFKSKTNTVGAFFKEAAIFYAGRGVAFLLDMLITFIFVETFADFFIDLLNLEKINYNSGLLTNKLMSKLMGNPKKMNEFIWSMLSQVMILIINYIFSKLVVFRKPKEKAVQEK
jgi:putative flippase GtrA